MGKNVDYKWVEGYFAIYQGREYQVNYDAAHDRMKLCSRNPEDVKQGFVEIRTDFYMKVVSRNEIQSAYEIKTYADYEGHSFRVESIMNGKVHLSYNGSKPSVASRLGFKTIEPFVLEKIVGEEAITRIWQEAVSILDYPLPHEI